LPQSGPLRPRIPSCPAIRCRSTRRPAPGRAARFRPTAMRRCRTPGRRPPAARRCRVQRGQQQLMQYQALPCSGPRPAGKPEHVQHVGLTDADIERIPVAGPPPPVSRPAAPSGARARSCDSASSAIGFSSRSARAGPLHGPNRGTARALERRTQSRALLPRPASAGLDRPLELAGPGAHEHSPQQVYQRSANHKAEHAAHVNL
jgi:hypothetical protein